MKTTPALMKALESGDGENIIAASTPGGIEAQEARGQADLVKSSDRIPKNMDPSREAFEKLGIIIKGDADDIFYAAELPKGWSIRATDHSLWSELLDDKGRVRAMIFYKAAFYDRSSRIFLNTRYAVTRTFTKDHEPHKQVVIDTATGEEIWMDYIKSEYGDKERGIAERWLSNIYPAYKDPLAYWDK